MINSKSADNFFCDLAAPIHNESLASFNDSRALIMDTLNSFTTKEESHKIISSANPDLIVDIGSDSDREADNFFLLGRLHASFYPGTPPAGSYSGKVLWLECAGYQYFWVGVSYETLLRNLACALFHLPVL